MNMNTSPQLKRFSVSEAKNQILGISDMSARFGANTNERDLFDNLIAKLEVGEIDPDKAVEEAHLILSSKNGFHTMYR